MSPIIDALLFIIKSLFELYLLILMLRAILFYFRFDYYHPISQVVIKLTAPIIKPISKIIPSKFNIEFSTIVVLLAVQMLKFYTVFLIQVGTLVNPVGVLIVSIGDCFNLLVYIFVFSIIINAVLSWVAPYQHNPLTSLLHKITEPLLGPVRRKLPPISGFDFSPMIVLLFLLILPILIGKPIMAAGFRLV